MSAGWSGSRTSRNHEPNEGCDDNTNDAIENSIDQDKDRVDEDHATRRRASMDRHQAERGGPQYGHESSDSIANCPQVSG